MNGQGLASSYLIVASYNFVFLKNASLFSLGTGKGDPPLIQSKYRCRSAQAKQFCVVFTILHCKLLGLLQMGLLQMF